ncbi:MAG TPA: SDR family oxidoreductase [Ramlibacter sp.]|nr:SDR family oxidoreductase [Ramlibacter sp.]
MAHSVALVTGASRNIGRAIAMALAHEGAFVAVNVRTGVGEGQSVVDEIMASGGQALLVRADVSRRDEVDAMVRDVIARFGALDILVNNAAVRHEAAFPDLGDEDWRAAFDVAVDGAFHCTQAAFEWLCKSRAGAVVNIGGMTASTGAANRAHVVAAKAGLEGLTRALAHEFAPHGVTVNCVAPGLIETMRSGDAPAHHANHQSLLGRRGRPEEIGALVAWLAGPGARYITGQTIHANGGTYMG